MIERSPRAPAGLAGDGAERFLHYRHNNATVICCHSQEKEQPSRLFAARRSTFDV